MSGPKGYFTRKGSWRVLRVGSFSLHLGRRMKAGARVRFVPMVYFRQKRRFPRVKGHNMLSAERAAECRRLIHGVER
jgi:hypothetical protein